MDFQSISRIRYFFHFQVTRLSRDGLINHVLGFRLMAERFAANGTN